MQDIQMKWTELSAGEILQRFGHYMRIVATCWKMGHLTEVLEEEVLHQSRQTNVEKQDGGDASHLMQGPGRPTKFVARSGGSGSSQHRREARPDSTPLLDDEPNESGEMRDSVKKILLHRIFSS